VPTRSHLEVLGPFQRRGIGTALIRWGEDTARQLGHRRLAIGVGVDNPSARRLYERLGYIDWGHGTTPRSTPTPSRSPRGVDAPVATRHRGMGRLE
jgi:RimJ/RimL family protein N-acetyltransferase